MRVHPKLNRSGFPFLAESTLSSLVEDICIYAMFSTYQSTSHFRVTKLYHDAANLSIVVSCNIAGNPMEFSITVPVSTIDYGTGYDFSDTTAGYGVFGNIRLTRQAFIPPADPVYIEYDSSSAASVICPTCVTCQPAYLRVKDRYGNDVLTATHFGGLKAGNVVSGDVTLFPADDCEITVSDPVTFPLYTSGGISEALRESLIASELQHNERHAWAAGRFEEEELSAPELLPTGSVTIQNAISIDLPMPVAKAYAPTAEVDTKGKYVTSLNGVLPDSRGSVTLVAEAPLYITSPVPGMIGIETNIGLSDLCRTLNNADRGLYLVEDETGELWDNTYNDEDSVSE